MRSETNSTTEKFKFSLNFLSFLALSLNFDQIPANLDTFFTKLFMNHSFSQSIEKNQFQFKYSLAPRQKRPLSHESFPSNEKEKSERERNVMRTSWRNDAKVAAPAFLSGSFQ